MVLYILKFKWIQALNLTYRKFAIIYKIKKIQKYSDFKQEM